MGTYVCFQRQKFKTFYKLSKWTAVLGNKNWIRPLPRSICSFILFCTVDNPWLGLSLASHLANKLFIWHRFYYKNQIIFIVFSLWHIFSSTLLFHFILTATSSQRCFLAFLDLLCLSLLVPFLWIPKVYLPLSSKDNHFLLCILMMCTHYLHYSSVHTSKGFSFVLN